MPYKISKHSNGHGGVCYSVKNRETGKVFSHCSTKENAKKQMRLLYSLHSKSK
jgi:hypothetical protein